MNASKRLSSFECKRCNTFIVEAYHSTTDQQRQMMEHLDAAHPYWDVEDLAIGAQSYESNFRVVDRQREEYFCSDCRTPVASDASICPSCEGNLEKFITPLNGPTNRLRNTNSFESKARKRTRGAKCGIVRAHPPKKKRAGLCGHTKPTLNHQPSKERMTIMASHSSATVREPHVNQTNHTTRTATIINALKQRARAVLNDRTIDPQSRAIIRYALETNDPWLAELVRRADANEAIVDAIDFTERPIVAKWKHMRTRLPR
jgi:hypothetical protein